MNAQPFTLLVKPAGAACNLHCAYCFYLPTAQLHAHETHRCMTPLILRRLVTGYLATRQPVYGFCWQGGEPTLMGLDFYVQATKLQERLGRTGQLVSNSLQTNALLIDDAWAEHLARYRFLVGCSLDGPAAMHDRYRTAANGEASHARVLHGIRTLQRHGVAVNVLVLVSQANVRRAGEVFGYLRDLGLLHQQYIPCLDVDDDGAPRPYAIGSEEWGAFLDALFVAWAADGERAAIRNLDALVGQLLGDPPAECTLGQDCRQYVVVEHNGAIYPCDFYVREDLCLGNVMDVAWDTVLASPAHRRFGATKAAWPEACATCDCLDLCAGGCPRHRTGSAAEPSRLCAGLRGFLRVRREELTRIAARRAGERAARPFAVMTGARAGGAAVQSRNEPCPCGSGRKFKKCCGGG